MNIAIIGAGRVGTAIAKGLSGKGYAITFGTRSPDKDGLLELAGTLGASVASPAEAARNAGIVILALPWAAAEAAIADLGPLDGKIVIDCMNPLGMVDGVFGLVVGHTHSGGEIVQSLLPGARVVKTLNQVGAEIMADNSRLPQRPVMFMAGNDEAAKADVANLLADLGFAPLDAGDITKSRILEPHALVWINQALMRGKGRNWAFAAISAE